MAYLGSSGQSGHSSFNFKRQQKGDKTTSSLYMAHLKLPITHNYPFKSLQGGPCSSREFIEKLNNKENILYSIVLHSVPGLPHAATTNTIYA